MSVHLFGIRHHGPGCARALKLALEALKPDAVLIEGPADADAIVPFVAAPEMVPPIALLVYAVDEPQRASFYPFAEFSPEWQALRYGTAHGVTVRFIDLPAAHRLAVDREEGESESSLKAERPAWRDDPIGALAQAAGFSDHDEWWDVQVELRRDVDGLFAGIAQAMAALREDLVDDDRVELQREAYMRGKIRAAQKEGYARIAVVCGAWHVPALLDLKAAKADSEILQNLAKTKVAATWIPWTSPRLAMRSGYGAGVTSPGWYAHVWQHGARAPVLWIAQAARLLRDNGIDASAANVIDALRLAQALASVRDLPSPGLAEMREAIEAALCGGQSVQLALIREHLEIGHAIGQVAAQATQVPLMRNFDQEVKRLRLKISPTTTTYELDLRQENDRDRSRLFHRLQALSIAWGKTASHGTSKGTGTFKEVWQLTWLPEYAVDLVAANVHGNTIVSAATRVLSEQARRANLAELSPLIEQAMWSDLPQALSAILVELDARAAAGSDVPTQMQALMPLARVIRYSDVRQTKAEQVRPVFKTLFERVIVGLVAASMQLDDEAAAQIHQAIDQAHAALMLLDEVALASEWFDSLRTVMATDACHPRLRGRSCRLLLDHQRLENGELDTQASLALCAAQAPSQAGLWLEGLVSDDALVLVHHDDLLHTLDHWIDHLPDEMFQEQVPLLRRAFAHLVAPQRRALAQRIKSGSRSIAKSNATRPPEFDNARVEYVLPILRHLLGENHVPTT